MAEIFVDGLYDAVADTLKAVPILFLAYLLVAFLSHDHSHKFSRFLSKDKKSSVLYASLLGCVPQCGFSSVVADLYSQKNVSLGTLIAVFVATSDEAIPLMISSPENILDMLILIGLKIVLAIFWGYFIDFSISIFSKRKRDKSDAVFSLQENASGNSQNESAHQGDTQFKEQTHQLQEHEETSHGDHSFEHHHECGHIHTSHCDEQCGHIHGDCCGTNIFADAFDHTFTIAIYIFVASFVLNLIIGYCGLDALENLLTNNIYIQILIAGLVGLIPNCAASVFLVELFMFGTLGFPALVAGLTTGAGVGLIILFTRNKKHPLKNMGILLLQYVIGIISGLLISLFL